MFSKATLLALAATAVSVDALSLHTPTNAHSASSIDVAWDFSDSDPTFTLELAHPNFRSDFALANNCDPASGGITVVLPTVTDFDAQYSIRAVNVSNINQEYARTGNFLIEQTVSSTTSGTASTTASSATNPPSGSSTTVSQTSGSGSSTGTSNGSSTTSGSSTSSSGTSANTGSPTNTPQNGGGNGAASIGISFGAIVAGVFAAVGLF
ncbi:hypothetical protein V5O48_002975 [Marasmius crinis-equi]|uniref:Uncharacterized protein n=1 Tax=Marasmius crinis-equi TaxID=585013 RepID=A0ABR3FV70_9AGAR